MGTPIYYYQPEQQPGAAAMEEPMLPPEEPSEEPPSAEGVAYTIDHSEYVMDASAVTCEPGQLWLAAFVVSGVALGMLFEALHLHAGPAAESTCLVPFFGYCGQLLVGGGWVLSQRSWRRGKWNRKMVAFMVLSSLGNGAAQALDYISLTQAGVMLYTILHSSTTLFACIIACVALRTRLTRVQWAGVLAVATGLVLTGIPSPIEAQGSFAVGLTSAVAGAFCLAASYLEIAA
jgi:drug/metabolite transporter (DMT)-like permease